MCEKFHQLLAVGRWFPPGSPVSSTRKLISSSSFHRLDMTLAVAEALNPNKPNRTDVLSFRVPPAELNISAFPPVLHDWVIKGLGMSSLVYATGHIKDPVPLIGKRRGLSPGGRFPPSFIHQVIIITGLNKLYNCMFSP